VWRGAVRTVITKKGRCIMEPTKFTKHGIAGGIYKIGTGCGIRLSER
jgi:hypothetical protein